MTDYKFTNHAENMLKERNIQKQWAWSAIGSPDEIEKKEDSTVHYIKKITEFENRFLRVVVNPNTTPKNIITVFFDRRLREKNEIKS